MNLINSFEDVVEKEVSLKEFIKNKEVFAYVYPISNSEHQHWIEVIVNQESKSFPISKEFFPKILRELNISPEER